MHHHNIAKVHEVRATTLSGLVNTSVLVDGLVPHFDA